MSDSILTVRRFVCSAEFQENCYVISPASDSQAERPCWIIDPGAGQDRVVRHIRKNNLAPLGVLLTHGHLDHVLGLMELVGAWPTLAIAVGRAESESMRSPEGNLSASFGLPVQLPALPTRALDDGDAVELGELSLRALATPGHSAGGVCFYCESSGDLFSGDVLFAGSVGRTDLDGGDGRVLARSIREKLIPLPDATRVWPGHGPDTTIGDEKRTNFFLSRGQ